MDKQYLDLLRQILMKGTHKPAAREGMPGSLSLFGHQMRHDLSEGFPLLTTKKMYWKGVVTELLWFLRGDTNIKYLLDNGVNIWNEDAFNYYLKLWKKEYPNNLLGHIPFDVFISKIKEGDLQYEDRLVGYKLGDCGYQYGKVWRAWEGETRYDKARSEDGKGEIRLIDQVANLITGLKKTPESRRHLVTAIDPAHDEDLALYWCHAMFQFNCRPLTYQQRASIWRKQSRYIQLNGLENYSCLSNEAVTELMDAADTPKFYLDCQLYQRSADVFLGVPFNIASYALLIEIIARICNMVPGEFIHTFGDVHIYDNHMNVVNEQLNRGPRKLPKLKLDHFGLDIEEVSSWDISDFILEGYNPHPAIKAELSTGLQNKG